MKIIDLSSTHIEEACQLVQLNYQEEKALLPILPEITTFPNLAEFVENQLGVAAFEGETLVGFLGCYSPWENHFGLTKGTFSPLHGHGSIQKNRSKIYDQLYQAASEKWVRQGILSHAISLYAHDSAAMEMFFNNGFGKRTCDAIQRTDEWDWPIQTMTIKQIPSSDAHLITPLYNQLGKHMSKAPMFMPGKAKTIDFSDEMTKTGPYFGVYDAGKLIAFLGVNEKVGETFICEAPTMVSLGPAFALPDYRGQGIYLSLLSWVMKWLKTQGYSTCGVDFETFNYTARNFWTKAFIPYTYGLTRRIDERIVKQRG